MSPRESGTVLPCFGRQQLGKGVVFLVHQRDEFEHHAARRCGLVAAQAGWAASALAMAASTSALLASATLACTSPVFGSKMSPVRPRLP